MDLNIDEELFCLVVINGEHVKLYDKFIQPKFTKEGDKVFIDIKQTPVPPYEVPAFVAETKQVKEHVVKQYKKYYWILKFFIRNDHFFKLISCVESYIKSLEQYYTFAEISEGKHKRGDRK